MRAPSDPLATTNTASAEARAAVLADEMADAWRRGERPPAEVFLARLPELGDHPQAAIRLIFEEICLRQELDPEGADPSAVVCRFPQWQAELEILLDCDRLLGPPAAAPRFPEVGQALGDFRLLAELGRGAMGRTFLAQQPALADRPIVLKVTPRDHAEHLSLARLQHTNIAPLYFVQDLPDRDLRVLAMPYLGGATLAQVLKALRDRPTRAPTGQDLLDALDRIQGTLPVALPARGPSRRFLTGASYEAAVCWIGAQLADALHYAHERLLVHLDVKPSNVLLAADGQPLLLDFHLARAPLRPDGPAPEWVGGTFGYMSPEQQRALVEVSGGKSVAAAVDGRADIYALGCLLYEMLGGAVPAGGGPARPRLNRCNPRVSVGLADIVHKCLEPDPRDRYREAAAVAADLRRHMDDRELEGVANRSPLERWRKWRRRRPYALGLLVIRGLLLAALVAAAGVVAVVSAHDARRLREAEAALVAGRHQIARHAYAQAVQHLTRGQALAEGVRGGHVLSQRLAEQQLLARRAEGARDLHDLADRIRFTSCADAPPADRLRALDRQIRDVWARRSRLLGEPALGLEEERRIRDDLLDLALFGAVLRVRQAPAGASAAARRDALGLLTEAGAVCGPSVVLDRERRALAQALGLPAEAPGGAPEPVARSAWEDYLEGRDRLLAGDPAGACAAFEEALDRQPESFWPNFSLGIGCYRLGRFRDAAESFRVCVALAPEAAECHYNRALALAALGHTEPALRAYARALELDPTLAAAARNRGVLFYHEARYDEAIAAFGQALQAGAAPAAVHYDLALVHLARTDRLAALDSLDRAVQADPNHAAARALRDRLRRELPE